MKNQTFRRKLAVSADLSFRFTPSAIYSTVLVLPLCVEIGSAHLTFSKYQSEAGSVSQSANPLYLQLFGFVRLNLSTAYGCSVRGCVIANDLRIVTAPKPIAF
jgi:hypothetical protein